MSNYIDRVEPLIRNYFNVLSSEFPEFLNEYINTPIMLKQSKISVSCGTYYSKMFKEQLWYSSLDHSVAVALIIWHFTHDKKQTLAGLFHDISTPSFKHCIDFLNKDYTNQESTEDLTKETIMNSKEIMELLKRDNIKIDEVCDYHMYSIADNDTPKLSADRLEYTLSNALGVISEIWTIGDIKKIYDNIEIVENDNELEMCFKDINIAKRFSYVTSSLSLNYINNKRRFSMQFLADIIKILIDNNELTINDLYNLSEKEIIEIIKNSNIGNIKECFEIWQNKEEVDTSDELVSDKYCVCVASKKRYINPLVKTNEGIYRISRLDSDVREKIKRSLLYSFDEYLYMDFEIKTNDRKLRK